MNATKKLVLSILGLIVFTLPGFTQVGHIKKIDALTFNKDGSLLLSASHDGIIILWNENGEKERIIKPEQTVFNRDITDIFTKVTFFNEGKSFIAGALSHAYIGNLETGEMELLKLNHSIGPQGIDVSSDGQYFICNDMFSGPGIEIRYASGAKKGAIMKSISEKGAFDVVAIKDDPDKFVCSGQLGGIKIMDIQGTVFTHFPALTGMGRLAISADSKYLMKGNLLYDVTNKKKVAALGIKSRISDVDFTSDGKIVTCHGHEVNIWDLSGKRLKTIQNDRPVTQAAISPEGKLLVFGDDTGQMKMYTVSGQFIQDYK